jgi:uncharacterized protein YndB with AHSA1/START domain
MKKSDKPIIVEQVFNASRTDVWNALTDIDEMKKWYFENIPAFEPVNGFKTSFNVISNGRNFLHKWEVTEVIPEERIAYTWRFEGYGGLSTTDFFLKEENGGVRLILTVTVQEDFQENIEEFKRESCIGGWNYFIKERLKNYLESKIRKD